MPALDGYFAVKCCKKRRGLLPGDVLVCPTCDYAHDHVTVIPNERHARDVPEGIERFEITKPAT